MPRFEFEVPWRWATSLFKNSAGFVQMKRCKTARSRLNFLAFGVIPMVHVIIHLSDIADERVRLLIPAFMRGPASCVMVVNCIDAAVFQQREKDVQGRPNIFRNEASIVKHNVDTTHFPDHIFEKFGIIPRPDPDPPV